MAATHWEPARGFPFAAEPLAILAGDGPVFVAFDDHVRPGHHDADLLRHVAHIDGAGPGVVAGSRLTLQGIRGVEATRRMEEDRLNRLEDGRIGAGRGWVFPRFLAQLEEDYNVWAAGDDARAALDQSGKSSLFDVNVDVAEDIETSQK